MTLMNHSVGEDDDKATLLRPQVRQTRNARYWETIQVTGEGDTLVILTFNTGPHWDLRCSPCPAPPSTYTHFGFRPAT